jgi:major membrane immunogen (membrane-anchored lipoprotein)
MTKQAFVPMIVLTLLLTGCGGEDLRQIRGTVTHNGKPVANLYLTFVPADPKTQPASSSSTDANGKFELKIGSTGGVVPGKYTVTASDPAAMMGGKSSDDPDYAVVCKKYAQGTSTYIMDVQKSNTNLELKLD